jgi:RNA-directed DNA polymerase
LEEIGRAERLAVPASDAFDPNYRRLRYCRYADDFIIGVTGSKSEARQIMEEVRTYLSDHLKLAVSAEKSGSTRLRMGHGSSDEVRTMTNPNPHKAIFDGRPAVRRGLADRMKLLVPRDRVVRFVNSKEWGDYDSFRPVGRAALRFASDVEIVLAYNAEWRGFANYYAIADDVKRKLNKAGYFALLSCVKTIAGKHRTSARRVFAKLRRGTDFYISYEVETPPGQ